MQCVCALCVFCLVLAVLYIKYPEDVEPVGSFFPSDRPESTLEEDSSIAQRVGQMLSSPAFLAACGVMMCLACIFNFERLMPLYLHDTFAVSPGYASILTAVMPLSIICSLFLGAMFIGDMATEAPVSHNKIVLTLMGGACGALAAILLVTASGAKTQGALCFVLLCVIVLGLCMGYVVYIPINMFVLEFGGPFAASTSAAIDASACMANLCFQLTAGNISQSVGWTPVLMLLLAIGLVSVWMMYLFQRLFYARLYDDFDGDAFK